MLTQIKCKTVFYKSSFSFIRLKKKSQMEQMNNLKHQRRESSPETQHIMSRHIVILILNFRLWKEGMAEI